MGTILGGRADALGVTFAAALILPTALLEPTTQAESASAGSSMHRMLALAGRGSDSITLPDGSTALVDTRTGVARVTDSDGTVTYRRVPAAGRVSDGTPDVLLPDKAQIAAQLSRPADPGTKAAWVFGPLGRQLATIPY